MRPAALLQRAPEPQRSGVFPDSVNVRVPGVSVPTHVLLASPAFTGKADREGEVYAESARSENLYLQNTASGFLLSGSLRNWAVATGLLEAGDLFDAAAVESCYKALNKTLDLPAGTLESGRLTKLEIAADLFLPRPVSDYARAADDLQGTTPWRIGYQTVYHKADKFEVRLYDKVEETLKAGRVLPASFEGKHVGRIEFVLHKGGVPRYLGARKGGTGVVCAGLLADPAFRVSLTELWLRRVTSLSFGRLPASDFVAKTATERIRWHAVQHILSVGGLPAELAQLDALAAAGLLTGQRAKDQKEAMRKIVRDPGFSATADLNAEVVAAITRVVGA